MRCSRAREFQRSFNLERVRSFYRSDLRELNETNFARFDAKMEQRISASEAKLEARISAVEAKLESRIAAVEAKLDRRIDGLETRIELFETKLTSQLSAFEARILRWTLRLWTGTMLTFVGLILTILKLK